MSLGRIKVGKKRKSRLAAVLITALLLSQFSVVSYGAEADNTGTDRYYYDDTSVSGPVIRFTVPPKVAEPVPEIPDFHDVFSGYTQTPVTSQNVTPTPAPFAPIFTAPTPAPLPGSGSGHTADQVQKPAVAPTPTPVVKIVPTPKDTPKPAGKHGKETVSENDAPQDMEGIPEGTPDRIRELIREGRERVSVEGTVSDDNVVPGDDAVSENNVEPGDDVVSENDIVSDNDVNDPNKNSKGLSSDEIPAETAVAVTGVEIHPHGTLDMGITKETNFIATCTIIPTNATNKSVRWSSGNTSVATVEQNGKVNFIGEGKVTITVTTVDGGYKDSFTVYVTFMKPKGVTLSPDPLKLYIGETKYITAFVEPDNLLDEYKKVTWTLPNTAAATLSATGSTCKVTGKQKGKFTVSVKTQYGGFTDTCQVEVMEKVPVTSVEVKQAQGKNTIYVGESVDLTAIVKPEEAYDRSVKWSYSSTDGGTVSLSSRTVSNVPHATVTGTNPGNVTIPAKNEDSGKSGTYKIKVIPVPVESIKVNPEQLELIKGNNATITVTVYPTSPYPATNKKVTWESSNTDYVTVSPGTTTGSTAYVMVTGVEVTATPVTITARSQDGNKVATCQVRVKAPTEVTKFEIDQDSLVFEAGDTTPQKVTATITPPNATNKTVKWEIIEGGTAARIYGISYDTSVCTLRAGTTSGNAVLRATLKDGDKTYTRDCLITVVPRKVKGITLLPPVIDMDQDEPSSLTQNLTATITPADAANKNVTWTVDDESVISLSGDGLTRTVNGLNPGTARVTVTTEDGGFSDTATVNVKKKTNPLLDLVIKPESQVVKTGRSFELHWELVPPDADHDLVTLSVNDPGIVTVEQTGENDAVVTGLSVGDTRITVTARNGDVTYSKTCHVMVEWINVTSVSLSCDEIFMVEGETAKLDATVFPANAEDKSVSWNSADYSVATVDQSGLVTAVSEGTTIVTVVTNDGGHKAVCAVHVRKAGVDVEDITVTPSENTINLGDSFALSAKLTPDNATDKTVIWSSNNPAVAVVNGAGLSANVVGMAVGSAVISAKASNGKTAFCIVNVEKGITHVTEILMPMFEEIYIGQSVSIVAKIIPEDADDKTIIWTSEDEDTVSVNSSGRITGKKEGKVTVIAKAVDGGAEARCIVTVINPKPDPGKYTLYIADERTGAYHPEMVRGMVECLAGDRYLVIFDSDGAGIRALIRGDSTLKYTQALFYDMFITDVDGHPKNDFVRCTVRIPLPPSMDIHKGTVRVVSKQGDGLDKSIPSSVGEEGGVGYVSFTATHFTEYAILYNKTPDDPGKTRIVYRDVPVIQYVTVQDRSSRAPAYTAQPAPVQVPQMVVPRILDSVPKTGDRNR